MYPSLGEETAEIDLLSHDEIQTPTPVLSEKHSIKPPSIEAVSAMPRLSDRLTTLQKPQLLPECSPNPS